MAKFFKVLMNIILILFIAALCAVFVPPFFGISVNVATPSVETNMNIGTVAYGVKESLSDISAGNSIVISDSDSVYLYEVVDVNTDNGELTVRKSSGSDTEVIELRRTASKAVMVVPFIGYILIALQSFEGLIIFGLAAALIVILFIISRVVAKNSAGDSDDDSDKNEDDFGYFKELAASTDRPSSLDSLATMTMPPVPEEPANTVPTDTIALDEEIEDLSELILERDDDSQNDEVSDKTINISKTIAESESKPEAVAEVEGESEPASVAEAGSKSEADTESTADDTLNNSADTQESTLSETSEFSSLEGVLEEVLNTSQTKQTPEDVVPAASPAEDEESVGENPMEIELAIPSHSLDELLQEAYAKGEDPHVKKDPSTGITLVDYSSCL